MLSVYKVLVQDRMSSDEEHGTRLIYKMLLVAPKTSGGSVGGV